MRAFGLDGLLAGITGFLMVVIVLAAIYIIAQLIVYSVLIFKCRKFGKETVQENFLGMKRWAIAAETFVVLDAVEVVLGIVDLIELITDWSEGKFDMGELVGFLFPILLLLYGIYAWRCYLRAKKINLHMFSMVNVKRRKNRFIEDEADLFGDSKMIDPTVKRTEEDKESVDAYGNRTYIQSKDVDLRKLRPLESGELNPCPYCNYLNARKNRFCVACGSPLPPVQNIEVAPISPDDIDIVDGRKD